MSLIVEDGSGMSTSESYCDVAFADTYHSNRNNADWAALTTPIKEGCLREATTYLIGQYRLRWKGRRRVLNQALDWPRVGVIIEDVIGDDFRSYGLFQVNYQIVPTEVQQATAEMALKASKGVLLADQGQRIKSETVGPISVVNDTNYSPEIKYLKVERMLFAYLLGSSAVYKLGRS